MEQTYKEFINNILNTRGRFACGEEYYERHHIIPKCMGGRDEEDNLIDLFAREHFIAHKLLALENPENDSLIYAWSCMAFPNNNMQQRYELTPDEYEEVRIALSETRKGKPRSDAVKKKISAKAKERYQDPVYYEKMKQAAKDRCTDEFRRNISERMKGKVAGKNNPMFGRNHTEDTRKRQSELKQGMYVGENNPMYGRTWWDENTPQEKIDEWRLNISKRTTGENNPNYGVRCTDEKRTKLIQSNPNTKCVVHLDADGELLGSYRSKREANRLTGINRQALELYCIGEKHPSDGTQWMFTQEYEQKHTKQND